MQALCKYILTYRTGRPAWLQVDTGHLVPALWGAGGSSGPPPPTPEETELTRTQTEVAKQQLALAQQQQKEYNAVFPLLLADSGYARTEKQVPMTAEATARVADLMKERDSLVLQLNQPPETDPASGTSVDPYAAARPVWSNRLTQVNQEIDKLSTPQTEVTYARNDPLYEQNRQIQQLTNERSLAALQGKLPVSPALEQDLQIGQSQLRERLNQQLGPGYENSTPGAMALSQYDRMATSLREAERRNQLTTAEALSLNRQGATQAQTASTLNTVGTPNLTSAQMLGAAGTSAGQALQYPLARRNEALQYQQMNAQDRAGWTQGGFGLGMAGLMATGMALSDPKIKEDIAPVADAAMLAAVREMPVSRWRYKHDPTRTVMLGAMAPDMIKEVSPTGKYYNLVSYLGLLTGAVRALDQKVSASSSSPAMALI